MMAVHSRGALREGGHHERLHQRDLPRPGRRARRARLRAREPVLLRQAARGARPARDRAAGRRSSAARRTTTRAAIRSARSSGAISCCAAGASRAWSSAEDAERAAKQPLGIAEAGRKGGGYYPAFLDLVRRQLRRDYEEDDLDRGGPDRLHHARSAAAGHGRARAGAGARRVSTRPKRKGAHGLEGVVVVTTPQTGEVIAMVGGRQPASTASTARSMRERPIGSLVKPVIYLTALETGRYTPRHAGRRRPGRREAAERRRVDARELRQGGPRPGAAGARARAVAESRDRATRPRRRASDASRTRSSSSAWREPPASCRRCCSARPT